jgi:hypothetical protein
MSTPLTDKAVTAYTGVAVMTGAYAAFQLYKSLSRPGQDRPLDSAAISTCSIFCGVGVGWVWPLTLPGLVANYVQSRRS